PPVGSEDQREAGQGSLPPRPRRRRGGLSGGRAPARHPARGRPARPQGSADDAMTRRELEEPVKAKVHITLKPGVLDPQGRAIAHALDQLGFEGVTGVRQGKYIELDLAETDPARAREAVEAMCAKLLANT